MQRNDRSYKDLKQKQKSAIADKTYKMYLKFLKNFIKLLKSVKRVMKNVS